ncbi:MAG: DUF2341 domain-containing protein [Burkholderiaceae bacterium]
MNFMDGMKRLRSCLAALMLMLPLLAHAGDDWAHKKKLNFDTTSEGADIKDSATQLPVLVRLHSGNFTFTEAKPDGSDVRFFAADGKTPLKFHFEKYDAANELAVAWVQVPKLTGNAKTDALWMQWGNPKAATVSDPKGTYDAAQILVFHFSDADGVKDATVNANNAKESTAKPVVAGPIAGSVIFDGAAKIVVPASASLKLTSAGGFTFSTWIKPSGNDNAVLYVQRDGGKSLSIGLADGILIASLDTAKAKASAALKPAIWQHVAVVANAGKLTFYVDGREAGGGAFAMSDIAGEATIGEGLHGELDEMMLSNSARTADYIKALASSQTPDTPMMTFADGDEGGESVSYFAILLGAVTVDGWVVIGILIVMAIISTWVMISKTVSLGKISKANEVFLQRFASKSPELLTPGHAEIATLESDANMKRSSIYHLYAIGLREMKHRFDAQVSSGKATSLSAAALDAIRASLDAAMVRENQRLNSGIVLLTIAISGGPFLGLLGTVVGVMITFAAIAAAGDVNVNAIAPGIAAALVATVAGLAVAIPALFGYNWLAIRIKNVSADTQVFADEFLTKSAEMHSN